ncbi:MAG: quinohemoprotein amine dehydrogenase subunit alpha, partial [Thermoanaerobaculia bacterium]|nr:quinohemoprotein amine dehydrogenase subunit alpha [Thermoanaerobaculia bacterium]
MPELSSVLRRLLALALVAAAVVLPLANGAGVAWAQEEAEEEGEPEDTGIRVTDQATIRACRSCHAVDDAGRMSRISFLRKTPEGWQRSVKRMVSLVDVQLEPAQARDIVRYLADHHGLAPEEARAGFFDAERRMIEHSYEGDETTARVCQACHSMGRVLNQRRSAREWELLVHMHRGYYPIVDVQGFRSFEPPEDGRHPMDEAIAHLAEALPLDTPEWTAWQATMRPPRLAGEWALGGYEPGRGPIYGTVTIADGAAPGEVETRTRFRYVRSGETVERTGRAILYTGFQWRGRSTGAGDASFREVLFVERDRSRIEGRWFTGDYDEIGADVTLRPITGATLVSGLWPPSVRAGGETTVRVFGAGLPADPGPGAIDLGPGLEATAATGGGDELEITVRAAEDAPVGARDLFVAGGVLERGLLL